jgi:hypothetical protein
MPADGMELLFLPHLCQMTGKGTAANYVFQELASILQISRHSLLQRLRRCSNVILPTLRNLNLINNECLAANIVITARPTTGAVTRAVPKIFRINVPQEYLIQVPLK